MIRPAPHRRRRGAAIVEMAAVLPIFVLLVLGMMDAARLMMVGHELTVASREGCRVAATNGKTPADVTARVNAVLTGYGLKTADVTQTPPSPAITATTPPLGTPITLTLSVPFNKVSYLPTPFLYGSTVITMSATMASERP